MVWPFAASFFAGFLTKHADESKKNDGLFAGCLYGFLLAWAASMDAFVAVVFVPAILANLIVGKIDSKAHALALSAFVVFIFYLKIPAFDAGFALLCLLAALADETVSHPYFYPRPFLPFAALIASFSLSSATPVLAVLIFDAGYLLRQWGESGGGLFFGGNAARRKANPKNRRTFPQRNA